MVARRRGASIAVLVTAIGIAGLFACQPEVAPAPKVTPIVDAGRRGSTPRRDGGDDDPPPSTTDAAVTASTICPAPAPPQTPAFVAPPLRGLPCTHDDVLAFVENESKTFDQQREAMIARNQLCAACVFTRETDKNWGPIVQTNDGRIYVSFGHCYAIGGGSMACAEAGHAYEWCNQKVCNVCLAPSGQTSQTKDDCAADQQTGSGPCRTLFDAAVAACSPDSAELQTTCLRSGNVVQTLCGQPPS